MLRSINPFSGNLLKTYSEFSDVQIGKVIESSHRSFKDWKHLSIKERGIYFLNLAKYFRENKDELAKVITLETGKLISESQAEIEKCALTCEYYVQNAPIFLENKSVKSDARESFIAYEPLGVIFGIMPWNFPFWQVLRFAIPTMLVGNTCILKHASNVSGCGLKIQECFRKAGFPKNTFLIILMDNKKTEKVLSHPYVQGTSLTGSTPAGKSVSALAGKYLKKSVLELGGSDPYIILEDADLELAVQTCVKSRMNNAGQTCIAAKRFIISEKLYSNFKECFVDKFKSYKIGDPFKKDTTLAPLARHDLRDDLIKQVKKSIQKGAKLTLGGGKPKNKEFSKGAFMEPTILENISLKNPSFMEEFFGPVALFFKSRNDDEALKIANATNFGLGAAIFTKDLERAKKLAQKEIEAGSVFINSMVRSDPRLPFGGIKESGYGRELSFHGMHEFVNIKTIYLD